MAGHASLAPHGSTHLHDEDNFRTSCINFKTYPSNLCLKTTFPAAIDACKKRLDDHSGKLFLPGLSKVYFRDFTGSGPNGGLERITAENDASLQNWLEVQSSAAVSGGVKIKADPKCRYIFITAASGQKPLNVTRLMLSRICTHHQVMPGYLDFLSVFGSQAGPKELRFSGFREQTLIAKPCRGLVIQALDRSGRQFQLCYNIKAVTNKSDPTVELTAQDWSVRQAAIYHQFDVETGTALWIITQGHLPLKERITEMTAIHGRPEDRDFSTPETCFRVSLTTHLLNSHWSTEGWRWYVQWLEEVIEKETDIALYGTRNRRGQFIYAPDHVQMVQIYEDKINSAIMVMEANKDVLHSLCCFYRNLIGNPDFSLRTGCQQDAIAFCTQIDDLIYDSKMQIARAKVLSKIVTDRKSLILLHLQTQAAGKMEDLTNLTIKIGTMSQREAIAMRIVTYVTLIYLPATFVSTFFSTDVVKYQNPNVESGNGTANLVGPYVGSFSSVALQRWVQIALPLTFLTLLAGWAAFRHEGKKADKEFELAQLPLYENESKSATTG